MLDEQVPSFGSKIISYSFYLLFFLTPLVWTPVNYELFEYNKMILVYILTTIITGTWVLKMIQEKTLILKRTPLDIPILLFLGANILSTVFSIDPHTSIWGYYSRSNGGLLSILVFTLLYFALTANFDFEKAIKILKMGLLGGLVVALWAIPEHFGVSPSCVILQGEFNSSCWVQDVQSRVFATLGQPNWLAAYLAMLIFPALYFYLTAISRRLQTSYYLLLTAYYLAFTFTYSRGATLGLIVGIVTFIGLQILAFHPQGVKLNLSSLKPILIVLTTFLLINLIFGSAITRFKLSQLIPHTSKESKTTLQAGKEKNLTQLETDGSESGQIRLIVWKGALDIFKHYPILGSGAETFAYSYYQFRPQEHNLVSEWDFLYNKAHNEYLNYLANTGIVGLSSYSIIIITFIIFILKRLGSKNLLLISLLASYISYLIQNIFGFSVVIIALFFYLFPAIAFIATDSISAFTWPKKLYHLPATIYRLLYYRPIYTKAAKAIVIISIVYLLSSIFYLWYADSFFAIGERASENGNPGKAYNYLTEAASLNPSEPLYHSELSFAAASAALALSEQDASLSAELKDAAIKDLDHVLGQNPHNTSFWRSAIRTYYALSSIDDKYWPKTIAMIDKTITLAPTDPKLYYNKAIILGQIDQVNQAQEALKKAIELKPNYRDAYFALSLFQFDQKKESLAVENMNRVLRLQPNDPDALEKLNDWGKKGIATRSGITK